MYLVTNILLFFKECNRLQRSWNHSIRSAAVEMGISPCLLVRWYQKCPQFEASLGKSKAILGGAGCLGDGPQAPLRNAWRKTGYNWFAKEGNMAGGGGVVVVSDGDGNMDDDNYDDDADILEDVLGAGDDSNDDYDDNGMM